MFANVSVDCLGCGTAHGRCYYRCCVIGVVSSPSPLNLTTHTQLPHCFRFLTAATHALPVYKLEELEQLNTQRPSVEVAPAVAAPSASVEKVEELADRVKELMSRVASATARQENSEDRYLR